MEHYFHDDDLHYAVEEFYDDFDDENLSGGAEAAADSDCGSTFSDFDDDFESRRPSMSTEPLSRVQISTMAVKGNFLVAGGFQGELICKFLNQAEVAFCMKVTTEENAISNLVDIFHSPGLFESDSCQ
ncbi:hypothetical protein SAY86_021818 [Trapa natans]|uniref:Uncharacterized protein n=1 Tax=Trapa natans TaxID=22666 RepID=A0AAN7RKI6_TRANT|nr:hypothetical protein SAY86_021818 [Trapa natans]